MKRLCVVVMLGLSVCSLEAAEEQAVVSQQTRTITDEEYSQYKAAQITQKVMKPMGNVIAQVLTLGGTLGAPNSASDELAREQAATLRQIREEGVASNDKEMIALEREKIALERERIALEMALLKERQEKAKHVVVNTPEPLNMSQQTESQSAPTEIQGTP